MFFLDLGFESEGRSTVEGEWVDNVIGSTAPGLSWPRPCARRQWGWQRATQTCRDPHG